MAGLGLGGLLAAAAAVLAYGYGAPWLAVVFALLAVAAVPAALRLSPAGKHGVPLLLAPADFNGASLSVGGDTLALTGPNGATRRWRRQADGARLDFPPLP